MTTGVLLLHGSSGKPDLDRARILEDAGYAVVAPRWFDGRISEIPLESFPLDDLAARTDRLVVLGISRGAEAGLLLGTVDPRIDAVIALSPSAYAWPWIENGSYTSPWTWQGEPLPYVPFDPDWEPADDPPSYVDLYRTSVHRYAAEAEAALIPAERFRGELLLVAGGDDRVWPSAEFAQRIALSRGDRVTQVLISASAGHRPLFPGEEPKSGGQRMARGGSYAADRAFGDQVWPHLLRVLDG
ncbi:bile acid acyltransferase/acyl-CoA thioester hydrolase-like protein [Kribbella amoyensis]|uniref:Bile acid acyltransferase/acyl-CoA thioester hydrolase-like protein n=1 Tax=Kribbella amoyensis TaxID=996641 RepID=A0A561BKW3_9ACTN|nr:acyl-CoA thioester hydrolase/BAAT C-terminal domain-containing protein [Kribbella amoyensis]TWD79412.1 bile acid acyltransferase/acyl-CoA thioester hydrolase-like protein [Kribbella amoyensis]